VFDPQRARLEASPRPALANQRARGRFGVAANVNARAPFRSPRSPPRDSALSPKFRPDAWTRSVRRIKHSALSPALERATASWRPPEDYAESASRGTSRRRPAAATTTPGDDRLATGRSHSINCCVTPRSSGARNSLPQCDLLPARVLRLRRLTHRLAQRDRAVEVAEVDAQQEIAAERLVRRCRALALAEVETEVPGAQRTARWLSGSPRFGPRVRCRISAKSHSTAEDSIVESLVERLEHASSDHWFQ
jgi:hypothetical protein